ncbi:hypothetical protein [Ramlibacter sp.]|uniref:hypothetical protein n=1 Tax=Ramlibacter sp. TaxID=1917967 RepID=UPI003D114265
MTTPTRYPLQWPIGWKRTAGHHRQAAKFGKSSYDSRGKMELSIYDGVMRVLRELERIGIGENDVVVSTNVETRLDGLPRSDRAAPGDPGVAVYWRTRAREDRVMAIDRYDRVADNLAAIAATLEAMRAIERHGGAAILDRAFTGFTALPAPIVAGMRRPWREVLEFFDSPRALTTEDVQVRYRRLAAQHHPDRGGDPVKMAELNAARDEALGEVLR